MERCSNREKLLSHIHGDPQLSVFLSDPKFQTIIENILINEYILQALIESDKISEVISETFKEVKDDVPKK